MGRGRERGASAAEYLGVIGAVAILLGGLLAVGEHRVRREAPVDPVEVVARVLTPPAPPRPPRVRPAPAAGSRPAPAIRRPRPARPTRPVVEVPRWAAGGW
jgi:hypothetical protein